MFSCTVIAATGERFADFAPYVASVNDAGVVAFQAALQDGRTGVFTGSGAPIAEAAGLDELAAVTSHPDVNEAGTTTFYGDFPRIGQGVFLLADGHLDTIADTRRGPFASIGPLGPTMNEAGMVAFRASRTRGGSGIFVGDATGVTTIADTQGRWSRFHGLPVINAAGTVVFRADREEGAEGVYAAREGNIKAVAENGELFESLAHFPSLNDDGIVAFAATLRTGGATIFTAHEGEIAPVVDTNSPFESFRGALITNGGAVVRIATPRGGSLGLFAGPDPKADRILGIGDPFEGSIVADLAANPVSVNSLGQVAIRASLADGRQLILRADPPGEGSAWGINGIPTPLSF